jgi:hypothetical protein
LVPLQACTQLARTCGSQGTTRAWWQASTSGLQSVLAPQHDGVGHGASGDRNDACDAGVNFGWNLHDRLLDCRLLGTGLDGHPSSGLGAGICDEVAYFSKLHWLKGNAMKYKVTQCVSVKRLCGPQALL